MDGRKTLRYKQSSEYSKAPSICNGTHACGNSLASNIPFQFKTGFGF